MNMSSEKWTLDLEGRIDLLRSEWERMSLKLLQLERKVDESLSRLDAQNEINSNIYDDIRGVENKFDKSIIEVNNAIRKITKSEPAQVNCARVRYAGNPSLEVEGCTAASKDGSFVKCSACSRNAGKKAEAQKEKNTEFYSLANIDHFDLEDHKTLNTFMKEFFLSASMQNLDPEDLLYALNKMLVEFTDDGKTLLADFLSVFDYDDEITEEQWDELNQYQWRNFDDGNTFGFTLVPFYKHHSGYCSPNDVRYYPVFSSAPKYYDAD